MADFMKNGFYMGIASSHSMKAELMIFVMFRTYSQISDLNASFLIEKSDIFKMNDFDEQPKNIRALDSYKTLRLPSA